MGMLSEWRKLPPKTIEGLGVKTAWIQPDGIIIVSPAFSTTLAKLITGGGGGARDQQNTARAHEERVAHSPGGQIANSESQRAETVAVGDRVEVIRNEMYNSY